MCGELTDVFEVIIVDDGSPDASGAIADELAPSTHRYGSSTTRGTGATAPPCARAWPRAATSGSASPTATTSTTCTTWSKLWRLRHHYDLIITFRYVRRYSGLRILISRVYNLVLRRLFFTRYRDVSTGLRLVRKEVVDELPLEATSPFIGAEIAIKTMLKGYRVGEMGIQTFPREFGRGNSTSPTNIYRTIVDMLHCHRRVFSSSYRPFGAGGPVVRTLTGAMPRLGSPPRPHLDPPGRGTSNRPAPGYAGEGWRAVAGAGRGLSRRASPAWIAWFTRSMSAAMASASSIVTSPRATPRNSSVRRFSGSRLQVLQTGSPVETCWNLRRAASAMSVSNTLPTGACFRQSEQHR